MKAPVAHDGYLGVAKGLLRLAGQLAMIGGGLCILSSGVAVLLMDADQPSDRAQLDIKNLHGALAAFRARKGVWPHEGWAAALVQAQLIAHEPIDPWDNPYRYRLAAPDGGPVVTSIGRDGVADTEDDFPRRTSFR